MATYHTSLVWFRNDIRLTDNEAYYKATVSSQYVIPFFCFDEHLFETSSFGFPRIGEHRATFLYDSVANVYEQLSSVGSSLIVRKGNPIEEITSIIEQLHIDAIFYGQEPAWEEQQRESELKVMLQLHPNISLIPCENFSLIRLEQLPFSLQNLPTNFTAYFNQIKNILPITPITVFPKPVAKKLPPEWYDTHLEDSLPKKKSIFPDIDFTKDSQETYFVGGEQFGKERVKEYLWKSNAIQVYKETRNGLLGKNYSSKFSAWLAVGAISARYIYDEILRYEEERVANDSTYWLGYELFWRDYFQLVAKKYGKQIFLPQGIKNKKQPNEWSREFAECWINGTTGIPFIDAAMRELQQTGFMSNRMRQNVASFLIHDLQIPWLYGAEYFEYQLLDYDASSNYGNWGYIAGVGCDPREVRKFNILKQAQTYDPYGEFVRHWIPELKSSSSSYPSPIVTLHQ